MDVYVMKDGRREGPYQPFRLREMLEEGTLTPLDSVWHEGLENWQALGETESLRGVLRKEELPPVLPEPDTSVTPARAVPEGELTPAVLRARRGMAWRRFIARQMDAFLGTALFVIAAAAAGYTDLWSVVLPSPWYLFVLAAVAWIVVESVMLRFLGWTPGRLVLGLRIVRQDGAPLTFRQALQRSALVWAGGLGFGLQWGYLLPVAQWSYGWWCLQKRGLTLWDHSAGTTVSAGTLARRHTAGIVAILALFTGFNIWLMLTVPLPDRLPEADRTVIEEMRQQFWKRE